MNKKQENTPFYFASCPREMESLLEQELKDIGIEFTRIRKGGVQFKCDEEALLEALFQTRIASRIYREVAFLNFYNKDELYQKAVKDIHWPSIFRLKQTFKINTLFDSKAKGFFKNSLVLSQKLKDAVVDSFREKYNERPDVNTRSPSVSFLFRVEEIKGKRGWKGMVYLDLCGEPLSNRGYRGSEHAAPLRENLAAALIKSTDWDPEKDIFFDPMCGSGTILIEALLIKGNIPPSYAKIRRMIEKDFKPFSFLHQNWYYNSEVAQQFVKRRTQELYDQTLESLNKLEFHQFYGNDYSGKAVAEAEANMKRAHLDPELVTFTRKDATKLEAPEDPPGVILTNPPYGERLGKKEEIQDLYYELGENFKHNFNGFRAYLITSNPELRKKISLQTSQRIPFWNGDIECRLLRYDLF